MSSGLRALPRAVERFLGSAGFDRFPWLAVAFASGIGLWFGLANASQWLALVCACLAAVIAAFGILQPLHRPVDHDLKFDQLILEISRNIVHLSFDPRLRGQVRTQAKGPGTEIVVGLPESG